MLLDSITGRQNYILLCRMISDTQADNENTVTTFNTFINIL
jgi:hypothetical protein